jgi:RNA polymerase sigma-70 factor (ECF subfamily)
MVESDSAKGGQLPERPEGEGPSGSTPLSLLKRARANDPEAWRRLVELYRPLVLFWSNQGGVRGADAEDVAQEVFAAAVAGMGRFRCDRPGDTFRGWLRVITRNAVRAHYRHNGGRPQAEGGSEALGRLQDLVDPLAGSREEEESEAGLLYRRAVEQVRGDFAERTWRAFWLTAIQGRSPAALADELGMSPAAIRQAKSRVLRCVKLEVGDLHDSPTFTGLIPFTSAAVRTLP